MDRAVQADDDEPSEDGQVDLRVGLGIGFGIGLGIALARAVALTLPLPPVPTLTWSRKAPGGMRR